jgi:hypothetical protein
MRMMISKWIYCNKLCGWALATGLGNFNLHHQKLIIAKYFDSFHHGKDCCHAMDATGTSEKVQLIRAD